MPYCNLSTDQRTVTCICWMAIWLSQTLVSDLSLAINETATNDCTGGRLFSQLALAFQIFQERLPLRSATKAIGLYFVRVDELQRIAVVEIVAAIVDDLAVNLSAAEHEMRLTQVTPPEKRCSPPR